MKGSNYTVLKIVLSLCTFVALSCNSTKSRDYAVVKGRIEICNNHDCWKVIEDSLSISRIKLISDKQGHDRAYYMGPLSVLFDTVHRNSDIEDSLRNFIENRIYAAKQFPENDRSSYTILTKSLLTFDSSSFCDSCRNEFGKYGFAEGTPPKTLYLKRTGFDSERELENELSRALGFDNYLEISNKYHTPLGKAASVAVMTGTHKIVWRGGTLQDAVQEALETYPGQLEYQRSKGNNPDDMTDAEWYNYMENLSSNPLWKESVREQKKNKGIE